MALSPPTAWTGARPLPDGAGRIWQIGPLTLWVARRGRELWVAHRSSGAFLSEDLSEVDAPEPPGGLVPRRLVVGSVHEEVVLAPRTSERPVVVRPELQVDLPPGGQLTALVSTACWVRVQCGPHALEVPTLPPKPTWSGTSPREGVLCVSGRTLLQPGAEVRERLPHRPITSVQLHNRSNDPLELVRVRLPLPHLALYADAQGTLWTASVRMELSDSLSATSVRLAPPPVENAVHLAEPRESLGDGFLRHLNPFA